MKSQSRRSFTQGLVAMFAASPLASWGAGRWGSGGGGGGSVTLTAVEKADLLFMREEEKVARDVYITLGDKWGTGIFYNIASSEQKHMDAILKLLSKYGLPDTVSDNGVGEFTNVDLQALYDSLVAKGDESLLMALQVGGIVEETDVRDLVAARGRTNRTDIKNVYTNLLNGSYNHLRAFAGQIESRTGQPYVAQVISQEAVDKILGK